MLRNLLARLRPRPLVGLAEIGTFAKKNLGTVLDWPDFTDWPGHREPGGPWTVSKRDLSRWMARHGFTREPETIEPVTRRRPKAAKTKSRWSGPDQATRKARW